MTPWSRPSSSIWSRSCSSCRSSCSCTSSATTASRARNGVRIEVFSIGFGPELFGRNDRHGTRWKFSAIPLGGYVKMHGDADAASATQSIRTARRATRTASPPRACGSGWRSWSPGRWPISCSRSSRWPSCSRRSAARSRRPRSAPCSRTARRRRAGILPGDRIVAVDGTPIASFEELQAMVRDNAGRAAASSRSTRDGETSSNCTVMPDRQRDRATGSATCTGSA